MTGASAFRLEGVDVELGGTRALRGVTLEAAPGESIAVIGPSGAGKTTLLRAIAGALTPRAGRARVLGEDPGALAGAALRGLRRRIGFVHQAHALVPMLRVDQNVAAGRLGRYGTVGGLRRVLFPGRAEALELHGVLDRVGIAEHLYTRVDRLSGGEQQRVAIARTLYQDPELWLADEPVAAVDPARARDVLGLLIELTGERGATLVASLHDVQLARELFPRIVGIRGGRVLFDVRGGPDGAGSALDDATLEQLYAGSGGALRGS